MESNSIGARVAERRNEMGLKQRELADMLSVKRETVNQWENGIRQIKGEDIARLADALGTTTDYILRGIKSENLSIAKETGLSDEAITILRRLAASPRPAGAQKFGYIIDTISVLSDLIASKHFHDLFGDIELYLISAGALPDEAYKSDESELTLQEYERFYEWAKGRGLEVIPRKAAQELYLQKACDVLRDICKEMLENGKHSREKE